MRSYGQKREKCHLTLSAIANAILTLAAHAATIACLTSPSFLTTNLHVLLSCKLFKAADLLPIIVALFSQHGLMAAVAVDPQALRQDSFCGLAYRLDDRLPARNAWLSQPMASNGVDQSHARRWDCVGDDVVELRMARVGLDPGFVSHSFGCDAQRFDAASQLSSPLGFRQRQAIAQCGFKDLDHADDSLFRIEQFDADCQGQPIAPNQATLVGSTNNRSGWQPGQPACLLLVFASATGQSMRHAIVIAPGRLMSANANGGLTQDELYHWPQPSCLTA